MRWHPKAIGSFPETTQDGSAQSSPADDQVGADPDPGTPWLPQMLSSGAYGWTWVLGTLLWFANRWVQKR